MPIDGKTRDIFAELFQRYHQNTCYPIASNGEVEIFVDAIEQALADDGVHVARWEENTGRERYRHRRFIGYDDNWGVSEGLVFDGGSTGLACFNGQKIKWEPTHVMPLPAAPVTRDPVATINHEGRAVGIKPLVWTHLDYWYAQSPATKSGGFSISEEEGRFWPSWTCTPNGGYATLDEAKRHADDDHVAFMMQYLVTENGTNDAA